MEKVAADAGVADACPEAVPVDEAGVDDDDDGVDDGDEAGVVPAGVPGCELGVVGGGVDGAGLIVIEHVALLDCEALSLTLTVKEKVEAAVGVPEIAPLL